MALTPFREQARSGRATPANNKNKRSNRTQTNVLLGGGLLAASQAMAGDWLLWQTNSLTYLYGKDFAVNPSIQQTITFEHADKWKYGDNFLFVDKIFYNGKEDRNKGAHLLRRVQPAPLVRQDLRPQNRIRPDQGRAAGHDLRVRRRRQRGLPDRPRLRPESARLQLLHPELFRHTEGPRPGDGVWQITPAGPTPFQWAAPTC
jgi:hypothetical protein